jgi:hypothetical protein
MVDRVKRWPGVEGDDEDAGEAERHTGELGYAGGAPQLHYLHPAPYACKYNKAFGNANIYALYIFMSSEVS